MELYLLGNGQEVFDKMKSNISFCQDILKAKTYPLRDARHVFFASIIANISFTKFAMSSLYLSYGVVDFNEKNSNCFHNLKHLEIVENFLKIHGNDLQKIKGLLTESDFGKIHPHLTLPNIEEIRKLIPDEFSRIEIYLQEFAASYVNFLHTSLFFLCYSSLEGLMNKLAIALSISEEDRSFDDVISKDELIKNLRDSLNAAQSHTVTSPEEVQKIITSLLRNLEGSRRESSIVNLFNNIINRTTVDEKHKEILTFLIYLRNTIHNRGFHKQASKALTINGNTYELKEGENPKWFNFESLLDLLEELVKVVHEICSCEILSKEGFIEDDFAKL